MKNSLGRIALMFCAVALAIQAGGLPARVSGKAADVDRARMLAADSTPGEWMGPGRTYGEQQIGRAHV
jgi:quinohemoprotein ethanol dehydrogenase